MTMLSCTLVADAWPMHQHHQQLPTAPSRHAISYQLLFDGNLALIHHMHALSNLINLSARRLYHVSLFRHQSHCKTFPLGSHRYMGPCTSTGAPISRLLRSATQNVLSQVSAARNRSQEFCPHTHTLIFSITSKTRSVLNS